MAWFVPLFYYDKCIILWLGFFPLYLIVFLLICFCSAYVIRLFGRCSRFLDPALDTSPLNWEIISFTMNFHYHDHRLSWILCKRGHGDLRCCSIFSNASMQWIKSQLAVLQWSQTLWCVMFAFFTLWCSVKWNCLRCCGFLFTFLKPKFDLYLTCKLH